jgi:hypothetical protein
MRYESATMNRIRPALLPMVAPMILIGLSGCATISVPDLGSQVQMEGARTKTPAERLIADQLSTLKLKYKLSNAQISQIRVQILVELRSIADLDSNAALSETQKADILRTIRTSAQQWFTRTVVYDINYNRFGAGDPYSPSVQSASGRTLIGTDSKPVEPRLDW